jgi:hypothetical protein
MVMLADQVDQVIGVDTHRDSHSAAIVAAGTGAVLLDRTVSADAFGYKRLLRFAELHATGRRMWAIESSGSYGSGLTTFLLAHGEWVVGVERPSDPRTATARNLTTWTRSARHAKRSAANTSPGPAVAATAKRSECCWSPAVER